ncbi:class A beta-lactamase [Streptomyces sp. NPDC003042]
MRRSHPPRLRTKVALSALTIVTVFAGAACGAEPSAPSERTARTGSAQAGASSVRAGRGEAHVRTELRRLEASYQGRIGAYALDTGTGKTIGYREHEAFPSNSTFKAVLCGAILDKARATDPGLMDRTLRWTKKDVVAHSPITGRDENIKNGMTPAELCRATITTSDNTAANMLLQQIDGPPGMTRYYRSLGDPAGRLDRYEPELNDWRPGEQRDTITPALMAGNLRELTLGTALVPRDRQRLIGWLRANTTGDERIRAGLPDNWTIGDKTGSGAGSYAAAHDIAIVQPPSGEPLIIAVYTHRDTIDAEIDNSVVATTASLLAHGLRG